MFGAAKRDKGFKDYCLILQVHPEADGAMIDAAYWHLARRYNEASSYDSNAKSKLEELNEAYIVLGSAEKREEYMKIRTRVLGEGALPQAPGPAPATPPLTVMARQRPQERTEVAVQGKGAHLPVKQILLGAIVFLGLLGVALAATTSPIVALAAIGLGAVAILAVAAVVAALPTLGRRPSVSTSTRSAATRKRVQDAKPLEKMKAQARQVREVPVQPVPAIAPLAPPVDADLDHAEPAHLRLLIDCSRVCSLSADFMLRGSDFDIDLCEVCGDICRQCADDCEQIDAADEMMRECAVQCRKCAEACDVRSEK